MIYRTLGAGLVDVPQPDTSALMKGALPDVTKLKAAAWGIPELDDMKAPELQYEKDLDTRAPEKLDEYYQKGQQLMSNATKLRSVGIDVTNPDPYIEGSIEASSLWSKDYNDWLQLGQQLKQSKKQVEQYNLMQRNPNVIVNPLPKNELVGDVTQFAMEIDRTPVQKLSNIFANTYSKPLYGSETLETRANEAAQAEKAISDEYDRLIAQNPTFQNKLESEKQLVLSTILQPISDTKFAQQLDLARKRLGLGWYKANLFGQAIKPITVETNVEESFKALENNKVTPNVFFDYQSQVPLKNIKTKEYIKDTEGKPIFHRLGKFIGMVKNEKGGTSFKFESLNGKDLGGESFVLIDARDREGNWKLPESKSAQWIGQQLIEEGGPPSPSAGTEIGAPIGTKLNYPQMIGYPGYGGAPIPGGQGGVIISGGSYNVAPKGW